MPKLSYSKTALTKEAEALKRYRQFLPSLDLKRQQLLAERNKAASRLQELERSVAENRTQVAANLPMLADRLVDLNGLVQVKNVTFGEENLVGVRLPQLQHLQVEIAPYSLLAKPHWVDVAVQQLRAAMELQIQRQIHVRRLEVLEAAVKKVTQRVNLFEKVLIPRSEENIRKIRLFLSDNERAGVIRAKLTKQKRLNK